METNEDNPVKGSNTETGNEDPMEGNKEEGNQEDRIKKNDRKMKNDDIGGNNKKMKKDDQVKGSNLVTEERNPKEMSNMKRNKDHPMIEKSVDIHDKDLKQELSEEGKKKDHKVDSILRYAESLRNIDISAEKLRQFKDDRYAQFTSSQREVFEEVVEAVKSGQGGCFFIEARQGRVKLDLLNAILAAVRIEEDESKCNSAVGGDSALAASSLQLTSHLLLGGRTFHCMFNASLNATEGLKLQIEKKISPAEIICQAKVIVVDEAVFLNKFHIEKLDDELRTNADPKKVFGGKVIVLAGDFRQPLPVGQGDRCELVINRSRLWSEFKVFTLGAREEKSSAGSFGQFDEWLQKLGNGDIPSVTAPELGHKGDYIELPEGMCIELQKNKKRWISLRGLIQFVFPSFDENIHHCAILAPKKDYVQMINNACVLLMPGTKTTCRSEDPILECTCLSNPSNTCPCSKEIPGQPPHHLNLKIGVPLILLATLQTEKLETGTRLTLKNIYDEHLECTIAGGRVVNIPKMRFRPVSSSDDRERFQFPVILAFATTIDKSQGLILKRVGVWLEENVFTHGQLYAAASCVERGEDIRFVLPKRDYPPYYVTRNVVFKKVFQAQVPALPT